MQKTILKQQYENFIASRSEGLDKTYDRFQKLISQLEIHGEVISQEDANLKFLRSLPSAWNNITLIMRNKSDLDTLGKDNVAFVSLENTSSTNAAVNTAHEVSTASSQGQTSSSTYANDVMFSFFANQSNSPQLDNEYLEQIDTDDLEEIDLKWQVAMLTMRVECYNCHMRGHFAKECRTPRNQGNRNGDSLRRIIPIETPANALVVQDGIGYQMGLESLEARIVVHEKNEAVYEEDIAFLKYDVQVKDISIKDLKNHQISAKDKAGLGYDSKMNKSKVVHSVFNSKESDVDDSPVNDRFKIGEGFHAVPPPYTRNYMPSRPDLSFFGLDDSVYKAKVRETITTASKTSKHSVEKPKTVRPSAPIIEDWDIDSDNDSVFRPKTDHTKPKYTKINFVKYDENVKSVNKENTHRQEEYPRKSQSPKDNRRNWNGIMAQKLGNGFEFIKKACFVCGSFNHLIKDCDFHVKKMRVNHQNKFTHPHPKRNFVPTEVVTKSGQVPVNAAKQNSPRAATSISTGGGGDCDCKVCKATNIIQGLAPDVYAIVNHHKVAKEIWDRVKLLMQGTKLSLQEKECKLYDEFDKFTFVKGETLYQYYWRFSQLINNMNLARDLHTTNYDQLYSYLEQHEVHANETRLMRERYQDPLAFVANYNQPPPQLTNYHSQYNPTYVPQQTNNMIPQVHSAQSFSPMYPPTHPSQPQINHSSVPPSHPYQSQMIHQTSFVPQIAYTLPQSSTQPLTEFPQLDSGLAVPVFNQEDDPIACLNKAMAFLTVVASLRFPLTNNQLRTFSNPRNQATIQDGRVTVQQVQGRQGQSYTEDLDAYDSDCDDVSNTKAVLMANLSSYGSVVLSEVPHSDSYNKGMDNQSVHAIQDYKQATVVDFSNNEIHSDSNIIMYSQYLQETQLGAIQDTTVHAQ
ncbi:ribonuclease H-like domain-containing protein [Tanacetum coccineum]